MSNDEIVTRLAQTTNTPSEVIYTITLHSILSTIVQRLGEEASPCPQKTYNWPLEEVEAINHNLGEHDGGLSRDHAECLALLSVLQRHPKVLAEKERKKEDLT